MGEWTMTTTRGEQQQKSNMITPDEIAAKRADERLTCTYCGKPMERPYADELHPWTPLCGECYSNEHRREVTARPVGLSEHQLKLYRVRSAYELSDLIANVNDAVYGGDANSIRGVADELVELADDIDAGEPDSRYTKETYDERPNPS
jgi:hypothetical protein